MGQTSSQVQEESYDSKDKTFKQDLSPSPQLTGRDPIFSSQLYRSNDPTLPPPRYPFKTEFFSSPTSAIHILPDEQPYSPEAASPVLSPNMSVSSPAPRPSLDLGMQVHDHGIPAPSYEKKREGKRRKKDKQEKKEKRRAAKLAAQQSTAGPPLEAAEEQSRFAEIWDSQEPAVDAKYERMEEEPATYGEDLVETQDTAPKKRKRASLTETSDGLQGRSGKRKNLRNGAADNTTRRDDPIDNCAIEEPDASSNSDLNFNDLAEQFYSGRKAKAAETEAQPITKAVLRDKRALDVLNGSVEGEADGDVGMHQHDNTDPRFDDSNSLDDVGSQAPPADYTSTSAKESNEPIHDAHDGDHTIAGPAQGQVHEDVEVPSSVPQPSSTSKNSAKRRVTSTASTKKKRMAKPDFFSRIGDGVDEDVGSQSPSTAALSRRSGKGKDVVVLEDETTTTPSSTKRKVRPSKIKNMLQNTPNGDNVIATPATDSAVRTRQPSTPVTVTGTFSDFEIRNLTQAVERFRDDHNMPQHQVNELIHKNPKESGASELWECVLATCPGRSRQKVINQTRRRFHNFVARGKWTPEQDRELGQMYQQYGNKYAIIGQLINRHPEDIRDRVRNYIICGDKLRRDAWDQEETDRLIAIVERAIEEIRLQRNKRGQNNNAPVEEDINWQMVSQGMDRTRSRLQCIAKWKALKPQLAGSGFDGETGSIKEIIQKAQETAATMSYRNRSLIIKEIVKSGVSADSRIPWLKVRTGLGSQWTRAPLMIVWSRLRRNLPNWQSLNVLEAGTVLLQHFQQNHKLEYPSETADYDYEAEYRDIRYKIQRGRRSSSTPKSAALIKESDDEVERGEEGVDGRHSAETEAAINNQPGVMDSEGTEEAEVSQEDRPHSPDLGISDAEENEREVEDSEPETKAQNHRRRSRPIRAKGRLLESKELERDESDNESSDTNASQVSSIPAR